MGRRRRKAASAHKQRGVYMKSSSDRSFFNFPTYLRFTRRPGRGLVFEEEVLVIPDGGLPLGAKIRASTGS